MLGCLIVASRKMSGGVDAVRRLSASAPLPDGPRRSPHDYVAGSTEAPDMVAETRPQRTGVISALLELVALKKAHWTKGIYVVNSAKAAAYDVEERGRDVITAVNLARFVPAGNVGVDEPGRPHEGTPASVLDDFASRELLADPSTGCYVNAASHVVVRHHNGGPVKWSTAHIAAVVVTGSSGKAVEKIVADNGGSAGYATISGASYVTVVDLDKNDANAGCVCFATFDFVIDFLVDCLRAHVGSMREGAVVVSSFAGYAKWNRAQLLGEFCDGKWGSVLDGGEYLETAWTRETAGVKWEEIVDGLPTVPAQTR